MSRCSTETLAQSVTGTVLGEVRDASRALVPGATVSLLHTGTGYLRTVHSDAAGEYTAPLLPTGTYQISAELTGFNKATVGNVRVGVDQKVRINLELTVGELAESVDVQADSPLLQTSSSDLSTTVEGRQIETMPLNGRNFVTLTRTIPGVLRGIPGANIDGAGGLAWRASASFSANGQRPRDNNFLLDGVDNNETWLQSVVIFPSVDALDEFKLQTSTNAAEFGKSLGGVVNLQIKSGANHFHGGAFGFLRDDSFDANNFFNNRAGIEKAPFRQHQFGATLGGPVRRDRTFFFASYQGLRIQQGANRVSTVPSDAIRNGDFSEINQRIYDPLTGQPFPGNVIPRDRWDPAAGNILEELVPPPNTAGRRSASGQIVDNYVINPDQEREDDQFDVKVDHTLSEANRFFVRYSYQKSHRFLPAILPQGDGFANGDSDITAQSLVVNDTHTFGPRWLNELRAGYSSFDLLASPRRRRQRRGPDGDRERELQRVHGHERDRLPAAGHEEPGQRPASGHEPGEPPAPRRRDPPPGTPHLEGGGQPHPPVPGDPELGLHPRHLGVRPSANLELRRPARICRLDPSTGFDVASFLLGYATSKTRAYIGEIPYTEKRPEWAAYVQDDFRVTSRLTLNLGLRWDVFVPWVEEDDRQSNFDPRTGRFVVASEDAVIDGVAVGRHLQTYSKKDFGPRFGFAYDASGNGRTLIRGGFGVFWNNGPGGTSSSKAQNPPFLRTATQTTSVGTNLTLSSGPPSLPEVDPSRPPVGSTRSAFRVDTRDAYALNWNLNLQRQLGRDYSSRSRTSGREAGSSRSRPTRTRPRPSRG